MFRLFIPAIGTRLFLAEPWTFQLHREHRNDSLMALVAPHHDLVYEEEVYEAQVESYRRTCENFEVLGDIPARQEHRFGHVETVGPFKKIRYTTRQYPKQVMVTLAAGTELVVERIYIRQGAEGFDSVTFRIGNSDDPRFTKEKQAEARLKKGGKIRFWVGLHDANEIVAISPPMELAYAVGHRFRYEYGWGDTGYEVEIIEVDARRRTPYKAKGMNPHGHPYSEDEQWVSERQLKAMTPLPAAAVAA